MNKIVSFWLFRFNINIYNMDAFMVCLLPFHESKIFIRAVQLLNLKSKTATKWDWLLPIQVNIWFFFTFSKNLHSFFIPLNRNQKELIILCVVITNSRMFILKASGVHLPRQTLINHCNSNTGFLSFLCERLYKTIKVSTRRRTSINIYII